MIRYTTHIPNHHKTWHRQSVGARFAGSVLFALCMLTACVNNIPGDDSAEGGQPDSDADGSLNNLNISTRTQDIGTVPTLPIHIYAFGSQGTFAAQQTLTTADADIVLQLPAGNYNIYALAGATDVRYHLPEASAASAEYTFTLQDGHTTHGEIQAGTANITLEDGRTTNLIITLTRIVAQVTATLSHLPADAAAVSIALQPLAQQFRLNGTCAPQTGVTTFALTPSNSGQSADGLNSDGQDSENQDTDGEDTSRSWITTEPVYLLPSQENITVSINITMTDGNTRTYAYNSNIRLTANYKHSLQATYTEAHGPDINGSLQSTDWAGEQEINFDFGPGSSGSSGNNTEPVTNLPAVGTLYQDCYVLAVTDATATSANLLLVAPGQWTNLTTANAESTISAYTTGTLSGWALPTLAQAEMLHQARNKISDMNLAADYLFKDGSSLRYFTMGEVLFEYTTAHAAASYHARAVKVQSVTLQ